MYNCFIRFKIFNNIIDYMGLQVQEKIALRLRDLGLSDSIIAVVDSDKKKWGGSWLKYKILSPKVIHSICFSAVIIITSIYLDEICQYL